MRFKEEKQKKNGSVSLLIYKKKMERENYITKNVSIKNLCLAFVILCDTFYLRCWLFLYLDYNQPQEYMGSLQTINYSHAIYP